MDQQLLDALNNMALALEQIAESLDGSNKMNTPTADALQSGDFSQTLTKISEGIDQIKEDNKKILDNQETIIKLQKQQSGSESKMFEESGEKKSMLRDGISVIILMAGAILAIGAAFKLIGDVDFVSVISLSIALPLMAMAFERIAKMKDLTFMNMLTIFGITTTMALSIAASSFILQGVVPVSLSKMVTAILISGMFAVISMSMKNLMMGATIYDKAKVSSFSIFTMFAAMAAGITAASWVMNLIVPISFSQGLTAIMIAAAFAAISYSMVKLMAGVAIYDKAKIDGKKLILALVSIAGAIVASSYIMNMIKPITVAQGLTALLIAGTFALISYNIEDLMAGVLAFEKFKVKPTSLFLTLVSISTAITASSWIMNLIVPISFAQGLTALFIAGIFAGISYFFDKIAIGMVIIDKTIGIGKLFLLPLFFTSVAAAITASSMIMSLTVPLTFSQFFTILGVGLALAVVTPLLGASMVLLSKIGSIKDYALGGLAVVIIASTIALSSQILSLGDYNEGSYPSPSWTGEVGLSLLVFGLSTLALGLVIYLTGSTGALAIGAGALAVITLAGTIAITSQLLSLGDYSEGSYPSPSWTGEVGLSLLVFGLSTLALGALILGTGGLAGGAILAGEVAVISLAGTILSTSLILSKGQYDKYPSKEWTSSVGLSMLGFGTGVLALGALIVFSGGIGAGVLYVGATALKMLAKTIVEVADIFADGNFKQYPSKEWSEGVASTFMAYSEMISEFGLLKRLGFVFENISDFFGGGLPDIAEELVKLDQIFSRGNFTRSPNAMWVKGVQDSIVGYKGMADMIKGIDKDDIERINKLSVPGGDNDLVQMADQFDRLGNSISRFANSLETINLEKLNAIRSLSSSVVMLSLMDPDQFENMMTKLESKSEVFSQLTNDIAEKRKTGSVVSTAKPVEKQDSISVLGDKIDAMTAILADISSVVGSRGTLKTYLMSIREKQIDTNVRSDARTKNILKKIGEINGISVYHFTYKFDPGQVYQGVIAQELIGTEFESALTLDPNGLYSVNYQRLGIEFKKVNI